MTFLRTVSDIVFPKRYLSAWARQEIERETRRQKNRDDIIKGELRLFANRMRTGRIVAL